MTDLENHGIVVVLHGSEGEVLHPDASYLEGPIGDRGILWERAPVGWAMETSLRFDINDGDEEKKCEEHQENCAEDPAPIHLIPLMGDRSLNHVQSLNREVSKA